MVVELSFHDDEEDDDEGREVEEVEEVAKVYVMLFSALAKVLMEEVFSFDVLPYIPVSNLFLLVLHVSS